MTKEIIKPPSPPPAEPLPVIEYDPANPTKPVNMPASRRQRAFIIALLVISTDLKSGKLGAEVHSHNSFGQYIRQYVVPTDPATTAQLAQRAALGTQSQVWRTLSAVIQAGWNSLAATVARTNRMGQTIFLSGQMLFNSLNRNLVQAGSLPITAVPVYSVPSAPTSIAGTAAAGANTFTAQFTATPVPAGVVFQVWATGAQSSGTKFVKGRYKFLQNIAAAATSPQNIRPAWSAIFGVLTAGQSIFLKIRAVDILTGVPSPYIQSAKITVAA